MSRLDLATEQKVFRPLRDMKENLPRRVLLALSGGADSMVMAEILWKWRAALRLNFVVATIHHGPTPNEKQEAYRNEARVLVRGWARARGLKFATNVSAPRMKSEAEFRNFRERCLRRWAREFGCEAIAFAHHQDDLLETRVIRLIRGSGAQGLRAMSALSGQKFRPLLPLTASEIRDYARMKKINFVNDPSNSQTDILRNWVRREWLPSLEMKRPGAVTALARSLETIVPADRVFDLAPFVGLRRDLLLNAPTLERRALVAQYLKSLGLKGYAQTHVEEILKRLSTQRKNLSFDMLGVRFHVSENFFWTAGPVTSRV